MPKYIDADAVIKNLPDDLPYKASVKRVLIQAPEAEIVEANEKDIPKKLKVEATCNRGVRNLYYFCPNCNGFRMETTKHCSNCGQALDWKETFREYALDEAYENAEKLVEEAEAREEKHGEWIKHKPNPDAMRKFHEFGIGKAMSENSIHWTCSCCGTWGTPRMKYCSECGAKMDKAER